MEELDSTKLTLLLRLKYHNSIADAVADPGPDIGDAFAGFQKYLYEDMAQEGGSLAAYPHSRSPR